jgi:hypothetical protein
MCSELNGQRVNILTEWFVVGSRLQEGDSGLYALVTKLEADSSLAKPGRLKSRIRLLDELDAYCGEGCAESSDGDPAWKRAHKRARALQGRIETLNSAAYRTIRRKIRQGVTREKWRRWIRLYGFETGAPVPGLGYDELDELVSGVLELHEPARAETHPEAEMVFYQPTPVRHIIDLIEVSRLSKTDVLVDLGSGVGHVPILTSIMTGSRATGIEIEPTYVETARDCAEMLGLSRVAFLQQDARYTDLSAGTVFYLYTPFTGTILRAVLVGLRREAENREIRVCTFGPCTSVVASEPWLTPDTIPVEGRITCFSSTAQR